MASVFDNPLKENVFMHYIKNRQGRTTLAQRCKTNGGRRKRGSKEKERKGEKRRDEKGSGFASGAGGEFRRSVVFTF